MCPACREPLLIVEFSGLEVDHCSQCRGSWFDAGELAYAVELTGAPQAPLAAALAPPADAKRSARACPRCRRRMVHHGVGPGDLWIDVCPAGDGAWLDAGELARLVRELGGGDFEKLAALLGEFFDHELKSMHAESAGESP